MSVDRLGSNSVESKSTARHIYIRLEEQKYYDNLLSSKHTCEHLMTDLTPPSSTQLTNTGLRPSLGDMMRTRPQNLSAEQIAITDAVSDLSHWVKKHEAALRVSRKYGFVIGVNEETRAYLGQVFVTVFGSDSSALNLAFASYEEAPEFVEQPR
jgi:hypothetical protein